MVGEVNLYLPYMSLQKRYYVQNAKVFESNGEPTSLEYIRMTANGVCQFCLADALAWTTLKKGNVCCIYAEVARAIDTFMKDAMKRDPLLCRVAICGHVAQNVDDYADHKIWHAENEKELVLAHPV